MGSLTDILSSGSGEPGSLSGSSTDTITDQIAVAIGGLVTTALKSVLGNLS
ncbi:hypothetical protein ACQR3Q_03475 [Dietzia natronolimnaea]|uniref:hypothetical protein n=1 Tax=Dietzia TaxID=37914 RepID=UPI00037EE4B9|nr:hypothetical protein [Dietzia sp. UCD-THP]